ncbi:MAG: hypothetical protein HY042_02335, partial [Spirochaetia bacterium]|nr:hypothetical protein [Spirochaetia bacterium]
MKHLLGTLVALLLLAPPARLAAQTAEKPQKKDSPEITTDEKVRILEEEVERLKVQKASKTYQSV